MYQNHWLRKTARELRRAVVMGVALTGLLMVGSVAGHVSHAASLVNSNYSRQVGSNDLIQNRHHLYLPHSKAAVAMDARTGQIVYAKNEDQRRLVASTGKLMDLYLVGRKINSTPGAWKQNVRINNGLRRMSYSGEDGGYHFVRGHRYSVGNLVKAAIIASSNNSAIALGQWAAGSNGKMLSQENQQARDWHLRAHFVSASGLENGDLKPWGYGFRNHGANYGNEVSAKDLAVIAYHIIKEEPWFLKYSRVGHMYEDGQRLYNYNEFLAHHDYPQLVRGLHVDGLKTGWTPPAGYCFVGTAKLPGRDRIITVVLHDDHQWHESAALMRYVYKYSPLLNGGKQVNEKPVKKGKPVNRRGHAKKTVRKHVAKKQVRKHAKKTSLKKVVKKRAKHVNSKRKLA